MKTNYRSYEYQKEGIKRFQESHERISIFVTPEEKSAWKAKADDAGLPLATFIKNIMNEKAK